jgi:DUF4097 and DUF4098 domain-containing protein YvlB
MKTLQTLTFIAVVMMLNSFQLISQKEIKKSFASKENLKISTVNGNCKIQKSNDNKINVHLIYTYPDDCFKVKFDESTDYLKIEEDFDGSCSGKSDWTIEVPSNTKIKFNSASGDIVIIGTTKGVSGNTASGNIKLEQISGDIDINTASGDLIMNTIQGDVDVNTASGNVNMESVAGKTKINTASGDVVGTNCSEQMKVNVASGNIKIQNSNGLIELNAASGDIGLLKARGTLKLNAASGNVEASNLEIAGSSSFNSASGDVVVELAKSSEFDLALSTASGDVDLKYNGNEVKGYFEFTARVDKGKIVTPFKFDKEEVVMIDGKKHDKKSFTKGSPSPKITLETSSGKVELSK